MGLDLLSHFFFFASLSVDRQTSRLPTPFAPYRSVYGFSLSVLLLRSSIRRSTNLHFAPGSVLGSISLRRRPASCFLRQSIYFPGLGEQNSCTFVKFGEPEVLFEVVRKGQVYQVATVMFISKLSRAGLSVAREFYRGKCISLTRMGVLERHHSRYLQPLFEHQSEPKVFQKHHHFSTTSADGEQKKWITVTFVDKDGEEKDIKVPVGMNMLEAAHENDIELEGACEGSLACSTCHVIVMDTNYYSKLEEPSDEENDMLDLAFGLTETSRLGCQVIANPELDGIRLAIPPATRNFAVDGYVPKPH